MKSESEAAETFDGNVKHKRASANEADFTLLSPKREFAAMSRRVGRGEEKVKIFRRNQRARSRSTFGNNDGGPLVKQMFITSPVRKERATAREFISLVDAPNLRGA